MKRNEINEMFGFYIEHEMTISLLSRRPYNRMKENGIIIYINFKDFSRSICSTGVEADSMDKDSFVMYYFSP